MKRSLLSILIFICCIAAVQAETSDEIKALKKELRNKMKIGSVTDDTVEKSDGKMVEQIRFHTFRAHGCDAKLKLRIIVELTDNRGKGDPSYATLTRSHHKADTDFTGDEEWEFEIPHGSMKKPKITAYVIQSGVMHNKIFIPIAEDLDDVDSEEEIIGRENTRKIEMECAKHSSWYKGR